ncbi:MAG: hypothetical protein UHD64_06060 [Bacteroidales bacterium]|nr:hypothetical protein [Bacteroidales bacterium]
MVVSLGSSQVLRWMPELTGGLDRDAEATRIKQDIKHLKTQGNSSENKKLISQKYDKLYELQFQPHYMMLVMDSPQDYRYACEHGFKITIDYGYKTKTVEYKRFLGTAGSIKKSTIMFVDKNIHSRLMKKINNGRYEGPEENEEIKTYNGRELNYKFIPAKLNAYFALACSASIPVPWPRIIVIDDVETSFEAEIREVKDSGNEGNPDWPSVTDPIKKTIKINTCDGMGFITPQMSAEWAQSLNEGSKPLSGYNVRCAFLKGMVFTIDFQKFAAEVAGTYLIKDAWGDERDVRDADVILTVSMLKLWNSYAGCDDYIERCRENGYEFCIAKSAPHELRNVHTTNYQYLQDFRFSDEQIDELIEPTVSKIKECLGLDWRKLILYMCGTGLDEKSVVHMEPMCKAIMANPELIKDPYVRTKVSRMIQKRIRSAKIGVLDVEGDYAIIGCDPYALLQNMFGMEVTGILKAGECYHKYWSDKNVSEVIAFRAPMTSHENVCKLNVVDNEETQKWFKYITTCCMLNGWDTTAIRCNGADYDADTFFTTNNRVLLDSFEYKTTLMCLQDSVPKKAPTEEDYIKSDINGFGDSIGSVTNKATNMISLMAQFKPKKPSDPKSEEYKRLEYRISTMMNYQQNAIDRIKGVVARPVPNEWLNPRLFKIEDGDDEETIREKQINANIAAEIKPWFFIYRYSSLKSELDKYMKSVKSNCKIRFGRSLEALCSSEDKSEEEKAFIYNYEKYMPVSRAPGTMNRICWRIEDEFSSTDVLPNVDFDCSILKSSTEYTQEEYEAVKQLYEEYNKNMQLFLKQKKQNELGDDEVGFDITHLKDIFIDECSKVCPNIEVLANIVVDVCYTSNKNKTFAWDVAGEQIFNNVLKNNGYIIKYPIKDDNGDIEFCGNKFSLHIQQIGGDLDVDSE